MVTSQLIFNRYDSGICKKKPFIALNCAAIPRELMESEIFGHVKGGHCQSKIACAGRARFVVSADA